MMAGIPYREVKFPLQSGDVVVFMTDGIIEVQNSDTSDQSLITPIHRGRLRSGPLPSRSGDTDGTYYADSGLL